jgi:hypothetical protein
MKTTTDYEKFKLLSLNRKLDRNQINKIKRSITNNGYIGNPILVNSDFEIFDGQHRFMALKEMGIEIPYEVVPNDYDAIVDLNTTHKNWTLNDYVNYYCERRCNSHFIRLRRTCDELKTSVSNVLTMGYGNRPGGQTLVNIKRGILSFTIDNALRARTFYENYIQICKLTKLKPTQKLCSALVELSSIKGFNWKTMLTKASKYPTMAYSCRNVDEYTNMLREMYNYNTKLSERRI